MPKSGRTPDFGNRNSGIHVLVEDEYRKAYASFGRKDDFFRALCYETARCFPKNWHGLSLAVSGIAPDG
ncbi:MAG: hypothetical protein LBK05_00500 [Treponema sp.]|nr:hypothetical protein [Treponema sp.]